MPRLHAFSRQIFTQRWSSLLLILLLQCLTLWAWTRDLKSIDFLFIGDEWAFYEAAEHLAQNRSAWLWLSLDGVYGEFPVLGSVYQSLFLRAFGIDAWSWKLSSISVIVPLGVFFWLWLKRLFSPLLSLCGVLLLDFSFYLFRFFQVGYSNNLSLLFLVILLAIIVRLEWESARLPLQMALLGFCTGLSWYFYLGKLFPFLLGAFLLWRIVRCDWWKLPRQSKSRAEKRVSLRRASINAVAFAVPVVLLVGISVASTPNYNLRGATSKSVVKREFKDNAQFVRNVSYGWRNQWFTSRASHYLPTDAYSDRISATFITLGLAILTLQVLAHGAARRHARWKFFAVEPRMIEVWVLWLGLTLAIGLSSPYPYPPTTRGIHYVPFYICFALYAAQSLLIWSQLRPRVEFSVRGVLGLSLLGALWLNVRWMSLPVSNDDGRLIYLQIQKHQGQRVLLSGDCNFNWRNVIIWCRATKMNVQLILDEQTAGCGGIDYIIGCYPLPCYAPVEVKLGPTIVGGHPRQP